MADASRRRSPAAGQPRPLPTSVPLPGPDGLISFFTVQDDADRKRLAAGGDPWPTGLTRACIGPGLYCWATAKLAARYRLRLRRGGATNVAVIRYSISAVDLSQLRVLDLTNGPDDDAGAWADVHSEYGSYDPVVPHHEDVVVRRNLNVGLEFYFSPAAFRRLALVSE